MNIAIAIQDIFENYGYNLEWDENAAECCDEIIDLIKELNQ